MQKSFIFALGAFVVAAFLFVFGGQQAKNGDAVTSFEVGNNGITVNNDITGESFVIADDVITEVEETEVIGLEPASGDAEVIVDDVVGNFDVADDVKEVLAIEEDVVDMVEDGKTAESIKIDVDGMNVNVDEDGVSIEEETEDDDSVEEDGLIDLEMEDEMEDEDVNITIDDKKIIIEE